MALRKTLTNWISGITPMAITATQQAELNTRFQSLYTENEELQKKLREEQQDDGGVVAPSAAIAKQDTEQQLVHEVAEETDAASTTFTETLTALEQQQQPDDGSTTMATPTGSTTASATSACIRSIPFPELTKEEPRIAMSACLLGHEVRYNKGHCHARSVLDPLSHVFKFVPVCPEVDIGLGVPRPTLRLVADGRALDPQGDMEDLAKHVSLWCPDNSTDYTAQMKSYTKAKVDDLRSFGCDGFLLKAASPTCGLDRVKLYQSRTHTNGRSMFQGIFAGALMQEWPELAVSEEGRMVDEDTRNNFIQHAQCHYRWRNLDGSFKSVLKFHETHKYVLLAQDPRTLKELGKELAKGPKYFRENNIHALYYKKFFGAMKVLVGRGRHVTVLQHLCGYLKNTVDAQLYTELLGSVDDYKDGLVPLVVPLKMLQLLSKTVDDGTTLKDLLVTNEYIKGAPRSLKLHTSISQRTESKVPVSLTLLSQTGTATNTAGRPAKSPPRSPRKEKESPAEAQ